MKALYVNGEKQGEAERIVANNTSIVGYNGNSKAFALCGFNFNISHEVRDGQGNIVDFDVDELTKLKQELALTQEALDFIIMGGI